MAGLMNGKEVLLLYVIFSVETYQKNNGGRPAEDSGRLAVLNKQQRFDPNPGRLSPHIGTPRMVTTVSSVGSLLNSHLKQRKGPRYQCSSTH